MIQVACGPTYSGCGTVDGGAATKSSDRDCGVLYLSPLTRRRLTFYQIWCCPRSISREPWQPMCCAYDLITSQSLEQLPDMGS
jgi:hypothetical protein